MTPSDFNLILAAIAAGVAVFAAADVWWNAPERRKARYAKRRGL